MPDLYIPVPEPIVKPDGRMTRALQLFLQKLVQGLGASGSGTVTHTGALTDHAVIVGNGTDDIQALSSLGTATTLLHGNVTGDPAFSSVVEADLALTDITTANVTISAHGFTPKLPNDATKYLNGTGGYTVPTGSGTGTVTNTGTLTDHAVIVGNGGVDVSALGSLGTTTTVLHGNASADPAFSSVVEADLGLTNITTANVSTSAHGFAPILPNDATKYLDGTGAYTVPPGTGSSPVLSQSTTLTDSQILGLGSTPITIVSASGASTVNYLITVTTSSDFSAGAYSNPTIFVTYAGSAVDLVSGSSSTLNNTTKRVQNMPALAVGLSTSAAANKAIVMSASTTVTGGNAANQYIVTAYYTTHSVL